MRNVRWKCTFQEAFSYLTTLALTTLVVYANKTHVASCSKMAKGHNFSSPKQANRLRGHCLLTASFTFSFSFISVTEPSCTLLLYCKGARFPCCSLPNALPVRLAKARQFQMCVCTSQI
uniref:Putative secreted protein n=1 Tax=Anopheles darlingi TaxID=43151 RepID=A0A2M4DDR7_ANODA